MAALARGLDYGVFTFSGRAAFLAQVQEAGDRSISGDARSGNAASDEHWNFITGSTKDGHSITLELARPEDDRTVHFVPASVALRALDEDWPCLRPRSARS
jgi:hypothetical protein